MPPRHLGTYVNDLEMTLAPRIWPKAGMGWAQFPVQHSQVSCLQISSEQCASPPLPMSTDVQLIWEPDPSIVPRDGCTKRT